VDCALRDSSKKSNKENFTMKENAKITTGMSSGIEICAVRRVQRTDRHDDLFALIGGNGDAI